MSANRGSGTIRQVSGTVRVLEPCSETAPKPSGTVLKRRNYSKVPIGASKFEGPNSCPEIDVTVLEARTRRDRHPLLDRPPATPKHCRSRDSACEPLNSSAADADVQGPPGKLFSVGAVPW